MCAFVHMCVHSPISHYDFAKCGPIITKLHMEVAGYDTNVGQGSRFSWHDVFFMSW